ncbi:uncharacterized protein VDAG_05097 [Verticillium dahliae VdLs.17]|uniref:Hypervirulence associated protein TUDOR domain-containing protein n=2 Tax=Verticillium dahliae TaxID=27337 RepID=G2X4L5_VERDV|nr:uncharacterized protein VDAG_05097 [Verticillium dahliae VdLs.17]EGY23659.1 hypothetical protein VDAG_05097 [Verticillium dahliae VdLs.17]KAH6693142.1 hypothetical protein EV126DRAFT_402834 [Verticillium dahliae]
MTASDLETWLKSDDANSAGWPKDDADGDGETVGHDSGRKIVEILKANPDRKEDKYTDEQVEHMRKVVAYCKRHLAQEAKGNEEKTDEEVKKTKSYASLKNWGHDFLKAEGRDGGSDSKKQGNKKQGNKKQKDKKENDKEEDAEMEEADEDVQEEDAEEEDEDEGDDKEDGDAKAGDKRKKTSAQNGANKKRETRQGKGSTTNGNAKKNGDDKGDEEAEEKEEDNEEYVEDEGDDDDNEEEGGDGKGKSNGGGKPKKGPKKGDTVSWNWGGGQPEGKVLDVKGEDTSITTKNGNQVTRKGDAEDPAVVIDAGKSKAIKSAHELN